MSREPSQSLPPLRIAQVAPPMERVPPHAYGGTERIVDELSRELAKRGHQVVLFASADSTSPGRLVPTIAQPLRADGVEVDPSAAYARTIQVVLANQGDVDVIHAHLDFWNAPLARAAAKPVVATFHGRLDYPHTRALLEGMPAYLVAISRAHSEQPDGVRFDSFVYNGLSLDSMPFGAHPSDDLCFVGRMTPEKGVVAAIEVAAISGRRLRIVAKAPYLASEREYYDSVVRPALRLADVEELGELGQAERDQVLASSFATLMPSDWPEPFGLTTIESMACGTPVIARAVGALPEIVRHGRDGFLGKDAAEMATGLAGVAQLDRAAIRREVIERFSAARMADSYERIYRKVLGETGGNAPR